VVVEELPPPPPQAIKIADIKKDPNPILEYPCLMVRLKKKNKTWDYIIKMYKK
jgi:hypothetical protein